MKRLAILFLVLLLVVGAVLYGPRLLKKAGADLGGFSGGGDYGGGGDFGGGSSWSSSDWGGGSSWSSSSWDSDGDSGWFSFPIGVFNDGGESSGGYGGFLIWAILITVGAVRFITGLVRGISGAVSGTKSGGTKTATRWKYSKSHAASFSVLWKVWLALAAGGLVIVSGTFEDLWYYAAGALNIAVSVWASLDVIRKQNLLASRDIPLFSMKRGGAE